MASSNAISFSKLTAAGNDFVCIDNTTGVYDSLLESTGLKPFIQQVCSRALGVGADGVIFGGPKGSGEGVDICARFFEPDGNEARLCGNGTACFSQWAIQQGLLDGSEVTILTAAGTARCKHLGRKDSSPIVCIPDPKHLRQGIEVKAEGQQWQLDYLVVGVPHGVVFLSDEQLDPLAVKRYGKALREHPSFAPQGINVNFVRVLNEGQLAVQTYEFGVEDETMACGTGSSAAAVLACLKYDWPETFRKGQSPIEIYVRSGETLRVWAEIPENGPIQNVCLETPVQPIYHGVLEECFVAKFGFCSLFCKIE